MASDGPLPAKMEVPTKMEVIFVQPGPVFVTPQTAISQLEGLTEEQVLYVPANLSVLSEEQAADVLNQRALFLGQVSDLRAIFERQRGFTGKHPMEPGADVIEYLEETEGGVFRTKLLFLKNDNSLRLEVMVLG